MTSRGNLYQRTVIKNISFPSNQNKENYNELNNGYRPHGGYRGTKRYPPSPFSFNKPTSYHEQINEDVREWVENEGYRHTPSYAIKVARQSTNSGESPLFINNLLAPSRLEQQFSVEDYYAQGLHLLKSSSSVKPSSSRTRSGQQLYYRPPGKHSYLSATSRSISESGSNSSLDTLSRYGRLTRSSILRARHRCNSAPISSSLSRKEIQTKAEENTSRRSVASNLVNEVRVPTISTGESVYYFLIGARYNRAHCLDARSAENFGVYMPRNNPLGAFMVNDKQLEDGASNGVPSTPPDSPASESDCEGESSPVQSPSRGSKMTTTAKSRPQSGTVGNRRTVPLMEQIINLEDGLSGKGHTSGSKSSSPTSGLPPRPPSHTPGSKSSRPTSGLPPSPQSTSRLHSARSRPKSAPKVSARGLTPRSPGRGNLHSGTSAQSPRRRARVPNSNDPPFVIIEGKSLSTGSGRLGLGISTAETVKTKKEAQVTIPYQPFNPPPPPSGQIPGESRDSPDDSTLLQITPSSARPKSSRVRSAKPPKNTEINKIAALKMEETVQIEQYITEPPHPPSATQVPLSKREFDQVIDEIRSVQQSQQQSEVWSEIASVDDELESSGGGGGNEGTAEASEVASQRRVRFADQVSDTNEEPDVPKPTANENEPPPSDQHHGDYLNIAFFLTEEGKEEGKSVAENCERIQQNSSGETENEITDEDQACHQIGDQ